MGRIRHTSEVKQAAWHDVGERSADGENWVESFEMTPTRQD